MGLFEGIYSYTTNDLWRSATLNSVTHQIRYLVIRDTILRWRIYELLDLGCGNGVVEFLLPNDIFCLGYDIDEHAISLARELNKHKKNMLFKVYDVEKLDENHPKFQAVLISEVLEHLENDENLLEIARKILQTKGILILTLPNIERFNERIRRTLKHRVKYMHTTHFREYRVKDAINLLKTHFRILEVKGMCFPFLYERYLPQTLLTPFSVLFHHVMERTPSLANWLLLVAHKKY